MLKGLLLLLLWGFFFFLAFLFSSCTPEQVKF